MRNIFSNLKQSYKNTKFLHRLITTVAALAVAAALAFNFRWDLILTLSIVAGVAITLEVIMFRPYFLSAAFLTALYGMMYTSTIGVYVRGLSAIMNENQLGFIQFMFYAAGTFTMALVLTAGWLFSNGRYWFTVFVGYSLHLASLVVLLLTPVNPIYIPFVALTPVIIWLIARKFWLYRRDLPYSIEALPLEKGDTVFTSNIQKLFPKSEFVQEDRVTIINNHRHILLMLPITPEESVEITHKGLFLDGEDISFLLDHMTKKMNIISKSAKIDGKKMFPIIYVTNSKLERGITPVTFRSRRKPDIPAGTVFLTKKADFSRFMKEVKQVPPLTSKELSRYDKRITDASTLSTNEELPPSE